MLKLAGRASEEESGELDDLLADNSEFRAEYELMQREIPAIKELIPMMKTPENSDEVMPEYVKTALLSEIREIFGNEDHVPHDGQTKIFPDPIFWKWGFGLAILTLMVTVATLWNQNSNKKGLERENRLLIGQLETSDVDLSESLTAREKAIYDLEKLKEGNRQLTQKLQSAKKELSESLTTREKAGDNLEKLKEGTRRLTQLLELAKKELSESDAFSDNLKYHIAQLEKQSQVLAQRLELAMGEATATALETIYIGEVVQFTSQTEGPPGLEFVWDFGDGRTSSASEPSYTYQRPGNYRVTCSVMTPNVEKLLSEEFWIRVLPPASDKPEVSGINQGKDVVVSSNDYIIVVDASGSMRAPIKVKEGRFTVDRAKRLLVRDQLVEYLEQIQPDGSRVYIVYFHGEIAEHDGKEAATEFIFDVKGKEAAIAQAKDYYDIIAGRFKFFSNGGTHLWSSFHKALEFAEKKKYYRAKDDKAKTPEIVPHILLLSDGKDDQGGDGEWAYDITDPPKNKDQIILKAHPWLPKQKAAVWYQLGEKIKVAWKGTVVVAGVDGNVDKPLNPPNASLVGVKNRPLDGGGSRNEVKKGDPIQVNPVGDKRYTKYEIKISYDGGKTWEIVPEGKFNAKQAGWVSIRIVGITKDGAQDDLMYVTQVYIEGAEPPPVAVIKPDFEVLYNKVPVKEGETIWTGKKALEFTLINKTTVMQMKKQLLLKWNVNGNANQDSSYVSLPAGKHQIYLTVNEAGKPANAEKAKPLNFSTKQVKVEISIKGAKAGQPFIIKQGMPVEFEMEYDGPKGATYKWNYGDGVKDGKEPKHAYQEPSKPGKPYQVEVEVILDNGEVIPLSLADTVQVTALSAKATATPNDPWPGQTVKFQTNANNVEKVTWFVDGNEMKPNGLNFSLEHVFLKPGKVPVFAMIKQKGLVMSLKASADVVVKDVDPQVVVINTAPFIGQPIALNIINAATAKGAVQFPPGFQTELTEGQGNKLDPKKLFFGKPGLHQIIATVTLEGVKEPFMSEPVRVDVRAIKIDIGVAPPKK